MPCPSSGIQWSYPSSLFYCQHLENQHCAANQNPEVLGHTDAWLTASGEGVWWSMVVPWQLIRGRKRLMEQWGWRFRYCHRWYGLLLSQDRELSKKNLMLTQSDNVTSARFGLLFWKWTSSMGVNNLLPLRPYDLHGGGISLHFSSQGFKEESWIKNEMLKKWQPCIKSKHLLKTHVSLSRGLCASCTYKRGKFKFFEDREYVFIILVLLHFSWWLCGVWHMGGVLERL